MKRIFFWTSMVIFAAVGIAISQQLQQDMTIAFAEVVPGEDRAVDLAQTDRAVRPVPTFTYEQTEPSDRDQPPDANLKSSTSAQSELFFNRFFDDADTQSDDPGGTRRFESGADEAEKRSIRIAQKLRDAKAGDDESAVADLQNQLHQAVTRAFDSRRDLLTRRMQTMQTKLAMIKDSLNARENRRERIIERRVEELLDPSIDWNATTLQAGTSHELPRTGTPIGLPGPLQIAADLQESDDVVPTELEPQPTALPRTPHDATYEAPLNQVTNLTPKEFRWDKVEELLQQLRSHSDSLVSHQAYLVRTSRTVTQLRMPWKGVTSDDRLEVTRLLVREQVQLAAIDRTAPDSESHEEKVRRISEYEKLYEKLRLALLVAQWHKLNKSLDTAEDQLNLLFRRWAQYQGEIADLELAIREKQLVFDTAEEIHRITVQLHSVGLNDPVTVLQTKLAADRARIALDRARHHLSRFQSSGDANPQFNPSQYQTKMEAHRELLNQVQEANPDLIQVPDPTGPGGGFF